MQTECNHDWDYETKTQMPYYEDNGYYYLDMICSKCGKKGREMYSFEGMEEE